jgi:co-chaperonin GroES (HSP10)
MGANVSPLRDLVLVESLDVGRERTTAGGIVIPATTQARAKTKSDLWRGRVIAVGPKVQGLEPGEDVIVHTWGDGDGSKLYSGEGIGGHHSFIRQSDIVCAVTPGTEVTW